MNHVKKTDANLVVCFECGEKFDQRKDLDHHIKSGHNHFRPEWRR